MHAGAARAPLISECGHTSGMKRGEKSKSLVPRPLIGGGGEGPVSTACACAVIIKILNNPITYGYRLYTFTDTFTVKYTENVAHAHTVDTRPSFPLPPIRRPKDEAKRIQVASSPGPSQLFNVAR